MLFAANGGLWKTKEIVVGGQTYLSISVNPKVKSGDEIIVVGYGAQSKRNVTGSISKVDMRLMENLPNTNVSQALRGRVAGVQFIDNARPGQGGSILIRGTRSLNGGNNPLIIVDGIQFNSSINDINPNDIESMEILKDASAAQFRPRHQWFFHYGNFPPRKPANIFQFEWDRW